MANHLLNAISRRLPPHLLGVKLIQPCASFHGRSRIGNRDVVGFGINGEYCYIDKIDYPMPAIRFKENTSDVMALREKEKGDWKKLTMEDKKALYRASFCQTFVELEAPTGEWKPVLGGVFVLVSLMLWVYVFLKKCVYPPLPESFSPENKTKLLMAMLDARVDPVEGLSSKYDYEKKTWK